MASSLSPQRFEDPQFQNVQPRISDSSSIEMEDITQHHEIDAQPIESGNWDPNKYMSLYKAAQKGDWDFAKKLFQDDPHAITAKITKFSETALHVAATAGHSEFVEELLKIMPPEALESMETKNGETVLHLAAISGITESAKAIVEVNPGLMQMCNNSGWVPLLSAAIHVSSSTEKRQKKMVEYLYSVTKDNSSLFTGDLGVTLLCALIKTGFYDIALSLVEQYPDLAIATDMDGVCALEVLAEKPTAFQSGTYSTPIDHLIYKCIQVESPSTGQQRHNTRGDAEDPPQTSRDHSISKGVMAKFIDVLLRSISQGYYKNLKTKQALALVKFILARISKMPNSDISAFFTESDILGKFTRSGISEFVVECLQTFPFETNKQEILKIAVEQRNGKIFRLIYEKNVDQKLLSFQDESGNTILHLAAKIAPLSHLKRIGSEVFQMQREMQWFKAVEYIVLDVDKSRRNNDQKTAYELFTEEHTDLMQKAEKWAKRAAESSMLVASLVATVVFAAAITVPGGQDATPPILNTAFLAFVVADALAFFFSITSAMMFITILTSRYTEIDFLLALPQKILLNLIALSVSISAMIAAFGAAFTILLEPRFLGAMLIIPIALLAGLPFILFWWLVMPSLVQMVWHTYGPLQLLPSTRKLKIQFIIRKSRIFFGRLISLTRGQ